jgi:glycosyltransferase involved in cell wall biosynthesis
MHNSSQRDVLSEFCSITDAKTVSIIIPCLNEEKYIARCLDSLLENDYDKNYLDIIIVDGLSKDRTRNILSVYCDRYPFIRVLDNPQKITPIAMNIGIRASDSDVILRIDAHTVYAPNYISALVNGLEKYEAENVGGIRETAIIEDTSMTLALSLAISHPFTVGNAYYRVGSDHVREVDTVFCGCFRRQLFDSIGFYNENITRNEDRDLNARIIENGGKIILDPTVKCTYYPRTNLWEYVKWNAYGPFRLFYNHKFTKANMIMWRNLIPLLFLLDQVLTVVAFTISKTIGVILGIPLFAYILIASFFSFQIARKYKKLDLFPVMLFVFFITHEGYALGSLFGLPWYIFRKRK